MSGEKATPYVEPEEFVWINNAYRLHFEMHGIQKIVLLDGKLAALTNNNGVISFDRFKRTTYWVNGHLPREITRKQESFISIMDCDWPHEHWYLPKEKSRAKAVKKQEDEDGVTTPSP